VAQYLPILVLLVLAGVFGILSLLASRFLAPQRPTRAKSAPYECGIVPGRQPPERFPVKFFLIAMIFIVFDIEIIFFFPFATVFREVGWFGFAAVLIFALCVFESFVYLIGRGALEWGPRTHQREQPAVSTERTTRTTIRRVGLEGRPTVPAPAEEAA